MGSNRSVIYIYRQDIGNLKTHSQGPPNYGTNVTADDAGVHIFQRGFQLPMRDQLKFNIQQALQYM